MKKNMALFALFAIVFSTFSPSSTAQLTVKLHSAENLNGASLSMKKRHGWALIYVDAQGTAPSFEFKHSYVDLDELVELEYDEELGIAIGKQSNFVSLKGLSEGYYLMRLPKGVYQITQFNAPFFNLPFKKHIIDDPRYRFRIHANEVNYIGHLFISKERTQRDAQIEFLDRYATSAKELAELAKILTKEGTLRHSHGIHSFFSISQLEVSE